MRILRLLILFATIPFIAACNGKKAPDEAKAEEEAPKSYFKNPAPPFDVELNEAEKQSPAAEFLEGDKLRKPVLYRQWVFVGSRLVAGTNAMFENIYMHPRHYNKFKLDHAWPDPAVLVRERIEVQPQGADFVMGEPRGVAVAVRDSKRFTENNGWAFFDFGETYPLANSAAPDGRAWFDSPDELFEYCPVIRGLKR